MNFLAVLLGFLLAGSASADARVRAGPNVMESSGHRLRASTGPLDGTAAVTAAYGLRLLRQAYLGTGAAIRLRRASDNLETDIGFDGSGNWDGASAAAHCAATNCFVRTWYDQSGNGRHAQQAAAANQPALIFSCRGTLPCLRSTGSTMRLDAASFTPAAVSTLNGVGQRPSGTGNCIAMQTDTTNTLYQDTTPQWVIIGTAGAIGSPSVFGVWSAATGVINGASSVLRVNATEATASVTGGVAAGAISAAVGSGASSVCDFAEAILWSGYALTAGERAALADNQKAYWGVYPLDMMQQASGAYSFRRLQGNYAGSAVRIRRASDNLEADIGFSGANFDTVTATTHCAATSCFVVTWYDQSGNVRHLTQATAANQPALVFNCQGSLPCLQATTNTQTLLGASFTPATGVVSLSAVANRVAGTAGCRWIQENGANNRMSASAGAGFWFLGSAVGVITPAAADAAWHSGTGVINGASSVFSIDGVEVTGSITGNVTAGGLGIVGGAASTCNWAESVVWDNYVLTAGERTALVNNQRAYWGF